MALPESRRRANDRWDKENMSILSCKVKKSEADAFRARATDEGMAANAVLARFVREYIEMEDRKELSDDNESS